MEIRGLSASSAKTYDWCQWQFYLTQVLGFESLSGPAAHLGTMSHKVLEILSRASLNKHDIRSKIWSPEYLWNLSFNHYYNLYPLECEKIKNDKLKNVCKGLFETIAGPYSPITKKTISAEAAFNIPIVDKDLVINYNGEAKYFSMRGRIDRVDKINDNTIEVIDYKSGSVGNFDSKDRAKYNEITLREEIQPRLYHLAAKHLYPWAENVMVTFIYFTDGGPITMPFCDNDITETIKRVKAKYFKIKNDINPDRNLTWKCKAMCSFFKDGTCDRVWEEKQNFPLEFITNKYIAINGERKHRK